MTSHFDLAIIGSGSGNSLATHELAGLSIAIIEESTFGGTCLNVGCIPTKMYVYPADLAYGARDAARLGVDAHVDGVRWADIRDRIFGRIDAISAGGREYRHSGTPNVTLFETHASFTGPNELLLGTGETITADQIVLATGSRATIPDVVLDSGVPFHTSDTVMRIDEVPRRVAIFGGGYIGAEFGHVFSSFGADVTVICRHKLLGALDAELSAAFADVVKDRWDVRQETNVVSLSEDGGEITIVLDDGSSVVADLLLVATGRVPNTDRLGIEAAGVQLHPDGRVVVDAQQRTTVPGIWALGDASTEHQLKHVANHEMRVVAHNLAHPDDLIASDHRFVPAAVFTHPQIAYVGLTEEQAEASGRRFVTARQDYGGTAYGWAMEDATSFCKLIADPETGQLLGAHLMGEQAATLIQPLIQAMSFGLTVRGLARGQYWIHPALTEVVENALLHLDLD
ncbi:mycothione reductase [Jatrophihabitans sp.]|uniref:mycothione reductase n=1 Tax=Jatrophihabitans sp. TaxID=1932789 RepID=UPI0030C6BC85|nr:mtr [Jatrophihabitans sp.]